MSQYDFGTIDPYVMDGVGLAAALNQWRDALYSLHRGAARPPYVVPGMWWIDDSGGPTAWLVKIYASPAIGDVMLLTFNTTTGTIMVTVAEILVKLAANPAVLWQATGNPADQKVWQAIVQAAGYLRYEALNDVGGVVGSIEFHRDGTIRSATLPNADNSMSLASTAWVRTYVAGATAGGGVATPTYDSTSVLMSDGTWPTINSNVPMAITQGQQVFSRSFTAVDPTHPIEVDITLPLGAPAGVLNAGGALFIDGATNAVAQNFNTINTSWQGPPVRIFWRGVLAAGPHTFSCRFGGQSANAWLNGFNGAPMGGGAVFASMSIREIGVGAVGPQGPPGPTGGPVAAPTFDNPNVLILDNNLFAGAQTDVVMQITNGTQCFSRNFTAVDATHPIEVDATVLFGGGTAQGVCLGMFIDGGVNAVAQVNAVVNTNWTTPARLHWQGVLSPGPHTFAFRFGGNNGTTMVLGAASARIGGGAMHNTFKISEVGVGQVGPQGPAGAAGPSNAASVVGRRVTNDGTVPATRVSLSAVSAALANPAGGLILVNVPAATVDLTTGTAVSTANGMDGHPRGLSAWVYLYLICTAAGAVAGLASLNSPAAGGPALPATYTSYAYMGAMRIDGAGNLLRSLQLGTRTQYTNTGTGFPLIASGPQGSISVPTYVALPVGAFVPPTANIIHFTATPDGNIFVMAAANGNSGTNANLTNVPPIKIPGDAGTGNGASAPAELLLESTNIYVASNGNCHVWALGWNDYLM